MLPRPADALAALALAALSLGGWPSRAQEADLDAVLTRALALHQSGDLEGAAGLATGRMTEAKKP